MFALQNSNILLLHPLCVNNCFMMVQVSALHQGEQLKSLQQHKLVECTDPNGNTPLSEAAAGGSPDTVRYIIPC